MGGIGASSSSESLSEKANAAMRSITGLRRLLLLRARFSKGYSNRRAKVPERIGSSSGGILYRDHFHNETRTNVGLTVAIDVTSEFPAMYRGIPCRQPTEARAFNTSM